MVVEIGRATKLVDFDCYTMWDEYRETRNSYKPRRQNQRGFPGLQIHKQITAPCLGPTEMLQSLIVPVHSVYSSSGGFPRPCRGQDFHDGRWSQGDSKNWKAQYMWSYDYSRVYSSVSFTPSVDKG